MRHIFSLRFILALLLLTGLVACGKTAFNSKAGGSQNSRKNVSAKGARNSADSDDAQAKKLSSQSVDSNDGKEDDNDDDNSDVTSTATNTSTTTSNVACNIAHDSVVSMQPALISDLLQGVSTPHGVFKAVNPDPNGIAVLNFQDAKQACINIGGRLGMPDYYIILSRQIRAQINAPAAGYQIGVWAESSNAARAVDLLSEHSLETCVKHLVICQM